MINFLPYNINFLGDELSKENFFVLSFEGTETINDLYFFDIKIVCKSKIDLKSFLESKNRSLVFTITFNNQKRFINGICIEASIENYVNGLFIYNIKIVPPLGQLDIGKDSKIYLDMNIEDVISYILKENFFISGHDYEFVLNPMKYDIVKENYEEIDYICQYQESSFRFIQRWCAEYGLRFHFFQDDNICKIIFTDYNNAFQNIINKKLKYIPNLNYMTDSLGFISQVNIKNKRVPLVSNYINNDLRYENLNLEVDGKIDDYDKIGNVELRHFGGTPFIQRNKNRYQVIEDERIKSQSQILEIESNEHFVSPGYIFNIDEHFFIDEQIDYLILKVIHKGNQISYLKNLQDSIGKSLLGYNLNVNYKIYENCFEAIDNSIEYRPQRVKNKPIILGAILAKIKSQDGGSQTYRSQDGAYQVKMPFDIASRKNKSSCWIHTLGDSQGKGLQIILRDGDDVLLGFLEGDPNRPFIIGSINQNGTIMEENTEFKIEANGYKAMLGSKAKEMFEQHKKILNLEGI